MIQELNSEEFILWSNNDPKALYIGSYGNFVSFYQQKDIVEIEKSQIPELIKLLKKLI